MPTNWYQIRAAAGDNNNAEIFIYGDIGESWFGESVTAANLVRELQDINAEVIDVRVNSYGGSVSDGLAIYNALRRHNATINVYVDGVAVSIASLITMAGDKVFMGENTLMMIHAPWGGAVGNSKEMRQYADLLDTYAKSMASSYARKTGMTEDEVLPLLTDGTDHWFTAAEAIASGYADELTDVVDVAASFNLKRYHNLPAAAAAFMKPKEDIVMPDKNKNPAAQQKTAESAATAAPATPAPALVAASIAEVIDINQVKAETHTEINARNQAINQVFTPFMAHAGVTELHKQVLADVTISAEAARDKLLAKLGDGIEPLTPQAAGGVTLRGDVVDQREKIITGMSNAVLMRIGKEAMDGQNPWRGMTLSEMAGACCESMGLNVRDMTVAERASKALSRNLVRNAQTTSDFPVILENTMHKLVLMGFNGTPAKWQRFCKIGDVSDFRAWNRIVPGLIGNLDTVNEQGEYLDKVIPDGQKNAVTATRKGNIIHISVETIVNDDTGYINDMAMGLGMAGQRTIDRAVFALLASNSYAGPTMSDGNALFSAAHNNLLASGSGTAPSVTSLDVARVAMAGQVAPGADAEPLDITPGVAVCATALGGDMRVINEAQYDPDTASKLQKPNKVRGLVADIVDSPRVGVATAWWLFGDPAVHPVIEVVFLNGQREPRLVEEENFRTSGLAVKAELPFGVGAVDWRGGYFNYGA